MVLMQSAPLVVVVAVHATVVVRVLLFLHQGFYVGKFISLPAFVVQLEGQSWHGLRAAASAGTTG